MRREYVHVLASMLLWVVPNAGTGASSTEHPSDALIASSNDDLHNGNATPPPLNPNLSYFDLKRHYDCQSYFESPDRPTSHDELWMRAQNAYRHVMTHDNSSNSSIGSILESSLKVPYSFRSAGAKGLGLFALERTPKGAIVADYRDKAKLKSGDELFRHLLHSTSTMRDVTCALLQCSGVESYCNKSEVLIAICMDDACFMSQGDEPNVGELNDDGECPNDMNYDYALRDIEVGEELLRSYEAYQNGPEPLAGWGELSLQAPRSQSHAESETRSFS